jgi:hypothetical protein
MEGPELIQAWRASIRGADKSWVVFEHGTCVVLPEPEEDLAAQATALLKEYGPVHVGTPAGDFNVITLESGLGWVVTTHHPDVLNFVGRDEVSPGTADVMIGLLGRSRRAQDAGELRVLHVEDRRTGDVV